MASSSLSSSSRARSSAGWLNARKMAAAVVRANTGKTRKITANAQAPPPSLSHLPPPSGATPQPIPPSVALTAAGEPPVPRPRGIKDVSNGRILGFGAELAEGHPGFHDVEYKRQRTALANAAAAHQSGDPIPLVVYTPAEVATWAHVLQQLRPLLPLHACQEFQRSFALFDFRDDEVPQLQDVHERLQAATGWSVRPVAGLMHPRDFLNGLAFRTFHSTQYMRHPSKPMYTPEPDIVHEIIGHVPMLALPAFCEMAEAIGRASLGASEVAVWHLTKVYWYTVEFGVVLEDGAAKAFGAGILSSYGELDWMASGGPDFAPFNPFVKLPKMSYKDGFQTKYLTLDSFKAGARLLTRFADHMEQCGGAWSPN